MQIIQLNKKQKSKKLKKAPKSHVGKMEGAINPPNWSGKLDTRLTPVHRYTLQENFPIFFKKSV